MSKFNIIFLLSLFVLVCQINSAVATDKFLLSIPDCYNVSVHSSLDSGVRVDLGFKDCSKVDDGWFCDCHNTNPFNLYLQNDGTTLNYNETRVYNFDIEYSTYDISFFNNSFLLFDRGNNFYSRNVSLEGVGENVVEVPVFIYKDRIIERNLTVDKIVYQDREVKTIQYVENTSKLDECNLMFDSVNKKNIGLTSQVDSFFWIEVSTIIIALIIILILKFKK